jgi:CubicO group peptidase (beta-lactamase class C family)
MNALKQVTRWPVPAAAVAVVDPGGVVASSGSDVEFAWASVTKLLTALAVLDAVQEGLVDLDEQAGPGSRPIRDHKSPHWTGSRNSARTFGHFGRTGTFLWVDPDAGLACACLTDRDFGPWAMSAWPALSDAILTDFANRSS